jgi:hypothetical protein
VLLYPRRGNTSYIIFISFLTDGCDFYLFLVYLTAKYNYNDQAKDDEMGRLCRTHVEKKAYRVLVGKPEGKKPLGGILLNLILDKYNGMIWTELIWHRIWISGRFL